jgi:hypothetical protein
MAMSSHQSARMDSDTWLTPPYIIKMLGEFDLDPCCPENMPWPTAKHHYTKKENGLLSPWYGRVWLNPPYSKEATQWLKLMADHNNGIALTFARTETAWFFENIWTKASGILFMQGRISFLNAAGFKAKANSGAPTCLISYGSDNATALRDSKIPGKYIDLNKTSCTPPNYPEYNKNL